MTVSREIETGEVATPPARSFGSIIALPDDARGAPMRLVEVAASLLLFTGLLTIDKSTKHNPQEPITAKPNFNQRELVTCCDSTSSAQIGRYMCSMLVTQCGLNYF